MRLFNVIPQMIPGGCSELALVASKFLRTVIVPFCMLIIDAVVLVHCTPIENFFDKFSIAITFSQGRGFICVVLVVTVTFFIGTVVLVRCTPIDIHSGTFCNAIAFSQAIVVGATGHVITVATAEGKGVAITALGVSKLHMLLQVAMMSRAETTHGATHMFLVLSRDVFIEVQSGGCREGAPVARERFFCVGVDIAHVSFRFWVDNAHVSFRYY